MSRRLSPEQAHEIRNWLEGNEFHPEGALAGPSEPAYYQRSRDGCRVRLLPDRGGFRAEVCYIDSDVGWLELDELVSLGAASRDAATMSPIELATSRQLRPLRRNWDWPGLRRAPGDWLYRKTKRRAHGVKVLLQMAVGIGAVFDVGWRVYHHSAVNHSGPFPFPPTVNVTIGVIAAALAVAAAIELAYTLFTPGPDEALDPLMLGLSSGILLLVTSTRLRPVWQFTGVLLGVLALGVLFLIRRHLLGHEEE